MVLHFTIAWSGHTAPVAADFPPAFFLVGALAILSIVFYLPLSANAGSEVTGHREAMPEPREGAAAE